MENRRKTIEDRRKTYEQYMEKIVVTAVVLITIAVMIGTASAVPTVELEKKFYGSSCEDSSAESVQQTTDGEYVFIMRSIPYCVPESANHRNMDKKENREYNGEGQILKTDKFGNEMWRRDFEGDPYEIFIFSKDH